MIMFNTYFTNTTKKCDYHLEEMTRKIQELQAEPSMISTKSYLSGYFDNIDTESHKNQQKSSSGYDFMFF